MSFQEELRNNLKAQEMIKKAKTQEDNISVDAKLLYQRVRNAILNNIKHEHYVLENDMATVICTVTLPYHYLRKHRHSNTEEIRNNDKRFFLFRDNDLTLETWIYYDISPKYKKEYDQLVSDVKTLAKHDNVEVDVFLICGKEKKQYELPVKINIPNFEEVPAAIVLQATAKVSI